jgi:anti-sigma B factor antagonist
MDGSGSSRDADGFRGGTNFTIERRDDADGTARLILRGELDLATQGDLREALLAEHRSGTAVVVVLDQLDYLDSAGIGELLDGRERAQTRGRRFAVTTGTGNVRRVLWIAGVLDQLGAASEPSAGRNAGPNALSAAE